MLRILHSLPRTHKLLLLPVATMVTVLGAHKIVTLVEDARLHDAPLDTVTLPLALDSQPGLPALSADRLPVADALVAASQALDATRDTIPLAQLVPSEIIDLDAQRAAARHAPLERAALSAGPTLPEGAQGPAEDAQAPEDAQKPGSALAQARNATPARALDSAAGLDDGALHIALVLGTLTGGLLDGPDDAQADTDATSYDVTSYYADVSDDELALFDDGPIVLEEEIAAAEPYVPEWQAYQVAAGDTFAAVAQAQLGLGYSEALGLLDSLPEPRLLTHWRPGQQFEYQLDEQGRLLQLRMMKNAREGVMVESADDAFAVASIERAGEAAQRLFSGTVSGSFARSAQATGLSSTEVAQVSHLLEKKLDFRRDTRRGDAFQVLVESDIIDGESFDSRVLAVQYSGARMNLTVVRNDLDNRFYTPEGASLDPAFRRRPFDGSYRLSSSFNPNRRHPITGRISPHRGTDFAMPIGTPIVAPADGRVEKVGNHPLAGRYLVIRHDNGYKTRFLHLSRQLVSRGDRVTMGERIALSGNTGRSTGPHLHYEVHVNNRAVDAMRVALPENTSLAGDALLAFQRQAEPLLAALQRGEAGPVVASTTTPRPDDDG